MTHLTAGPIPELPYANLILYLIKYHPSGFEGGCGGKGVGVEEKMKALLERKW